jgi:hypothetical protein
VYPGAADSEGNGIDENCDGVDGNLGIENVALHIQLSPNPTSDLVQIAFNQSFVGQLFLTDLNGKVLQYHTVSGLSHHLDLSSLQAGTYLIKIASNVHRIVKM